MSFSESDFAQSLSKLQSYIEENKYRGYDPYDALQSPFFKLPILKSNKLIRFGTQQLVKRLPFNIRPLLLVPKGYNPVTLGLCIQGYAYLFQAEKENQEAYRKKILHLTDELIKLQSKGYSGACWGYDFDWEARYAKMPAFMPTVVATGIISNALFVAYEITGEEKLAAPVTSSAQFVLNDLNRSELNGNICFSYSPDDEQQVFNASMKGVRILVQAYSINKDKSLLELAESAVKFVVDQQDENGKWGYSLASTGGWSDNYHTGYVLDCLHEFQRLGGIETYSENLKKGYEFYLEHFITEEGAPKFYHNNSYPIDCTAASQTILSTVRFGDVELASKVTDWMNRNMQKKNGSFAFRKYRRYTEKTSFMRWSDAWMFAAYSYLFSSMNK
ncbi:MAG: delta-aminolevulinic acid dehydratase [Flavobacteriales bacterium]|nr:delta-aminolevulinic acid dehydratase [Flavobacteriales bacterium]MCB9204529.1 delta-aminolevulinic acid dehydratase [Flavobacteriales bacterium]